MSSTPKHLYMYDAFNWTPPKYAHVGLLLDHDRQKLSKRNLDTDVSSFRNALGILPEALTNFVALLGWSHNLGKDAMTLEQLVQMVGYETMALDFANTEYVVYHEIYQGQYNCSF